MASTYGVRSVPVPAGAPIRITEGIPLDNAGCLRASREAFDELARPEHTATPSHAAQRLL